MAWQRWIASLNCWVCFENKPYFCRVLWQKRQGISGRLRIVALIGEGCSDVSSGSVRQEIRKRREKRRQASFCVMVVSFICD